MSDDHTRHLGDALAYGQGAVRIGVDPAKGQDTTTTWPYPRIITTHAQYRALFEQHWSPGAVIPLSKEEPEMIPPMPASFLAPHSLEAAVEQTGLSEDWLWYFLLLEARAIATRSKDPSTQCGAAVVDPVTKDVLGKGYNGFAPGVRDTPGRQVERNTKLALTHHAENNAIFRSQQRDLTGKALFVWPVPPCAGCASDIARANISYVLAPEPTEDYLSRWQASYNLAQEVLQERGARLFLFPRSALEWNMNRMQRLLQET